MRVSYVVSVKGMGVGLNMALCASLEVGSGLLNWTVRRCILFLPSGINRMIQIIYIINSLSIILHCQHHKTT